MLTSKKKKKPRALVKRESFPSTHALRQQALADFVSDPESRPIDVLYKCSVRDYQARVSLTMFVSWAEEDAWSLKRNDYWAEAQRMLLESTRNRTVETLVSSMKQAEEMRGFVLEWAEPIRDPETDEVVRYPDQDDEGNVHRFAGKPMLAVRPKNLEGAIASYLALDEAVRERRDEVLRLTGNAESASRPTDPVAAAMELSSEDIRSMAQALTRRRQPELEGDVLDIAPERSVEDE